MVNLVPVNRGKRPVLPRPPVVPIIEMYTIEGIRFVKSRPVLNLYIVKSKHHNFGGAIGEKQRLARPDKLPRKSLRESLPGALKTIFVFYHAIYTFTASKKVNLI